MTKFSPERFRFKVVWKYMTKGVARFTRRCRYVLKFCQFDQISTHNWIFACWIFANTTHDFNTDCQHTWHCEKSLSLHSWFPSKIKHDCAYRVITPIYAPVMTVSLVPKQSFTLLFQFDNYWVTLFTLPSTDCVINFCFKCFSKDFCNRCISSVIIRKKC